MYNTTFSQNKSRVTKGLSVVTNKIKTKRGIFVTSSFDCNQCGWTPLLPLHNCDSLALLCVLQLSLVTWFCHLNNIQVGYNWIIFLKENIQKENRGRKKCLLSKLRGFVTLVKKWPVNSILQSLLRFHFKGIIYLLWSTATPMLSRSHLLGFFPFTAQ